MNRIAAISLAALPLLIAGCDAEQTRGDAVRAHYDNSADAVEQQARAQPTAAARQIYQAHADALREEGKDREVGLEGGTPSAGQGSDAKKSR